MTEHPVIKGKTILFVDDRPGTMTYFIDKIKESGGIVFVKRTINGAADLLAGRFIEFVVIDLFLDPPDGRFDNYKEMAPQTGTNQGQLLGLHLKERAVPYLYLSAVPSWFQANDNEKNIKVLKKSSRSWETFIRELTAQLAAFPVTDGGQTE